ncbi:MAG: hypothetical protein JST46_02400 [Bacteroidetes bacterium]|nr:hypothetical protein [Bacteroidota bacterium]
MRAAGNLFVIGRVFFGVAITGMGILTVCYGKFPYMLFPPHHSWIPVWFTYVFGIFLLYAGVSIALAKQIRISSLLLGIVLLVIFCFFHLPYQIFFSENNLHFGDWENAAKELALAAGGCVVLSRYLTEAENQIIKFLSSTGSILFSLTIVSFAVDHYLYAAQAADYVPSWIPWHLFWMYFCGAALLAAGVAPIIKIRSRLASTLLGSMIFTWFAILHVPRIVVSPRLYLASEIASALLALAYSGIAFMMAGDEKRVDSNVAGLDTQ